ncbi:MAG: hypothetical protein ACREOH_12725, partial [Candidatus Entotheonellia bacterium]
AQTAPRLQGATCHAQHWRCKVQEPNGEGQAVSVHASSEAVPMETIPGSAARHWVRPGLTGVAQLSADRDIPRRHTFNDDALSSTQQRVWLDLQRIARSCGITCRGTWEHRGKKF